MADNLFKTGEMPGKGMYICTNCYQRITLDDTSDRLPPCPKCEGTKFKKDSTIIEIVFN